MLQREFPSNYTINLHFLTFKLPVRNPFTSENAADTPLFFEKSSRSPGFSEACGKNFDFRVID